MKKIKFLAVLMVLFTAVTLTSCSSSDDKPAAKTGMTITVLDATSEESPIEGATVALYGSLDDLNNGTNPVGTATSDVNGVVTFSNLTSKQYFWNAFKTCETNLFSEYTTESAIASGTTSSYECHLIPTGLMTLNNDSTTNAYSLTLSDGENDYTLGTLAADQSGGLYFPAGDYDFTAAELSGTTGGDPTGEEYFENITVNCGDETIISFPAM